MSIVQVFEAPSETQTLAMQEGLQTPGVSIFFLPFGYIVNEVWNFLSRGEGYPDGFELGS